MFRVGITGGIGSGKTTVCNFFELLNIPIFYADIEAKKLINEDAFLKSELKNEFGNEIYFADGRINKDIFAKIIFSNKENLQKSNSIIHPVVQKCYEIWCNKYSKYKYTLKEAAILFESGSYKQMDYIITVVSPIEQRIENISRRDNLTKEMILKKINNQLSDDLKINISDFVIYNDKNRLLIPQILEINYSLNNSE